MSTTTGRHRRHHWDFEEGFLTGAAATGAVLVGIVALLPAETPPPPRFSVRHVENLGPADPAVQASWELARALAAPTPLAWDACACDRPAWLAGGGL